jgi:hypothetical protein
VRHSDAEGVLVARQDRWVEAEALRKQHERILGVAGLRDRFGVLEELSCFVRLGYERTRRRALLRDGGLFRGLLLAE